MGTTTSLGPLRPVMSALDPLALCFYDAERFPAVKGCVALTIDDAPCHQEDPNMSMMPEVIELLKEFNAKATFFLCTDYVKHHREDLVNALHAGHEIANHGGADRPYSADSEEAFESSFLASEAICESLRREARGGHLAKMGDLRSLPKEAWAVCYQPFTKSAAVTARCPSRDGAVSNGAAKDRWSSIASTFLSSAAKKQLPEKALVEPRPARHTRWFRAPHADMSPEMQRVLIRHGFTNVLCDCFANDTLIADSAFIAETLLSLVDPDGGSMLIIHVPERGFREHNLDAIRALLLGLQERNMRVLTVSDLHATVWSDAAPHTTY